ncbi:hypothetical protein GQ457_07G009890 [Hibiscus cannabinus]
MPTGVCPQCVHVSANSGAGSSGQWYADTGATHHVTLEASHVHQSADFTGPGKLLVGDGKGLDISKVGNASLSSGNCNLLLHDVLLVPQITKNLISISKCARDNDVYFEFHADRCVVRDEHSGEELLLGGETDGLYAFNNKFPTVNNVEALVRMPSGYDATTSCQNTATTEELVDEQTNVCTNTSSEVHVTPNRAVDNDGCNAGNDAGLTVSQTLVSIPPSRFDNDAFNIGDNVDNVQSTSLPVDSAAHVECSNDVSKNIVNTSGSDDVNVYTPSMDSITSGCEYGKVGTVSPNLSMHTEEIITASENAGSLPGVIELFFFFFGCSTQPKLAICAAMGGSRSENVTSWSRTTSLASVGELIMMHSLFPSQSLKMGP